MRSLIPAVSRHLACGLIAALLWGGTPAPADAAAAGVAAAPANPAPATPAAKTRSKPAAKAALC